jgi:hypothetical protein
MLLVLLLFLLLVVLLDTEKRGFLTKPKHGFLFFFPFFSLARHIIWWCPAEAQSRILEMELVI